MAAPEKYVTAEVVIPGSKHRYWTVVKLTVPGDVDGEWEFVEFSNDGSVFMTDFETAEASADNLNDLWGS